MQERTNLQWLLRSLVIVLAALLWQRHVAAHEVGLSQGRYVLEGHDVVCSLVFSGAELATVLPELDLNHDGTLAAGEVGAPSGQAVMQTFVEQGLRAGSCEAKLVRTQVGDRDGVEVEARVQCAEPPQSLRLMFLERFASGHRHAGATTQANAPREVLVTLNDPVLSFDPVQAPRSPFGFAWLGIEHILTGYDHIAFVLGLITVQRRLRSVLATVTAFTLGHSVTLALASLNVWAPSPRWVEPAIAASIVYVAAENLWCLRTAQQPKARWRTTLLFGLVHGFGFAGALRDLHVTRLLPLALFNAGVEVGQLLVLAVFALGFAVLVRFPQVQRKAPYVLSAAIGAAGLVWLIARVASVVT